MSKFNSEKTVSANSNGIIISYGDANKHQYIGYSSYVKEIQLYGTTKYQQIDVVKLSAKQKEMYSKLMYGFKALPVEEVNKLTERAKQNLIILYTKAQRILTKWKQELVFSPLDNLLLSLFPNSPIVHQMSQVDGYLNEISKEDDISLKDLGITQTMIINKFIENNLLPTDFYQLT